MLFSALKDPDGRYLHLFGEDFEVVGKRHEQFAQALNQSLIVHGGRHEFGDSAVIFGTYLNVNDPRKQRIYMSDLRKAIWFAFKDAGIVIAFNQMDVHFDPPVTEAITHLRKIV